MRIQVAFVCAALSVAGIGCKKTGGTGGGGGGWLVGSSGLMAQVNPNGQRGAGYDLGATESLYGIACRYQGEAWVVGAKGTLLYTNDGGTSWSAQVPTTGDLRALATQDEGPVFVAGDGTFLTSSDTGAHWTELGDGSTNFRSVAAAQQGTTVLALGSDGSVWSYDGATLSKQAIIPGAHAIAISPDGQTAMIAGDGLMRSVDAGKTWSPLNVDSSVRFEDVNLDEDGDATAVGAAGAIASIGQDGSVTLQHVGTADLHTLHVADIDDANPIGYAAGEDGQVYLSTDAGHTWSAGPNLGRAVYGVDQIGEGHR